jgi:hypothetical protein
MFQVDWQRPKGQTPGFFLNTDEAVPQTYTEQYEGPIYKQFRGTSFLGIGCRYYLYTYNAKSYLRAIIWFPFWLPIAITLIPPFLWWHRRKQRTGRGFGIEVHPTSQTETPRVERDRVGHPLPMLRGVSPLPRPRHNPA